MKPFYTDTTKVNISSDGVFLYYKQSVVDLLQRNIDIFLALDIDDRYANFNFRSGSMWMYSTKTMFCGLVNEKIQGHSVTIIAYDIPV